jgi:hypothetical protein
MARPGKYPEELRRAVRMVTDVARMMCPCNFVVTVRRPGPDWGDDLEGEAAESPREELPSSEAWTAGQPCSALLSLSQSPCCRFDRSGGLVRLPRTCWESWSRFSR